jgi:molybdopterin-containing oxidoreductase family iron-sulfur binding subunit
MAQSKKTYWKSPEERDRSPEFVASLDDEFHGAPGAGEEPAVSRRSFLKIAGFAVAGGAVTGCSQAPLKKAIPYLVQPEEVVPGRAYWYASVCGACSAGCGILTKNRDGRPIKLEGNPTHPISRGGLCAVGQASVLDLYDSQRLKQPLARGKNSSWKEVDAAISGELDRIRAAGGNVRVLTGSVNSPSLRRAISNFTAALPNAKHVSYDPLSVSSILEAHERTHGARVMPRYHFDKADAIVSFDADFLGTWVSPVEYTEAYRLRRDPAAMAWHAQFEGRMSITGAKADQRICVSPSEMGAVMAGLAAAIASAAGVSHQLPPIPSTSIDPTVLRDIGERLWQARGRSLVVCGRNDVDAQVLANMINQLLDSYGSTIDLQSPSYQRQGSDKDLFALRDEMNAGKVAALFVYGVNPAYDFLELGDAIKKVNLVVSLAPRVDETSSLAHYVCPDHHYLEAWSDSEPAAGTVALGQPAIRPLGLTRGAGESFAAWSPNPQTEYDLLRKCWEETIFPRQSEIASFDAFWDRTLHDGHATVQATPVSAGVFDPSGVSRIPAARPASAQNPCVLVYPKVGLLDGRHAHNAWLQELPDPVTKVCWDNYVSMSPKTAEQMKVAEGDIVRVTARTESGANASIELPAQIQPGQHDAVLCIALGYGRAGTDRFSNVGPEWIEGRPTVAAGETVGKNAAVFKSFDGTCARDVAHAATAAKTGARRELAATQAHHTLTVPRHLATGHAAPRPIVQETTLAEFKKDPHAGAAHVHEGPGLWPDDHPYKGARWGMAIDLTRCTGCSSCVVSCQAENNIPVVGKDEVRRQREMHWMRIDRYYAERPDGVDVVFQPMMCQHCANAPCETVCPVLATVHSGDGLNTQVYNRCVGTRYCANNCPYKVRRFNWFDYPHKDALQNMVLNPDVTIRSRGVMEKCSFCVQRIQEAKAEAKRLGRPVQDGDVQPACAQSCPAQAIVFGDLNDPKSAVRRTNQDPRHYKVLAELNVQPAVGYLRLIRNRDEEEGEHEPKPHV